MVFLKYMIQFKQHIPQYLPCRGRAYLRAVARAAGVVRGAEDAAHAREAPPGVEARSAVARAVVVLGELPLGRDDAQMLGPENRLCLPLPNRGARGSAYPKRQRPQ